MTNRGTIWRVLLVALLMLGAWVGLGLRLAFLHLGPNEHFAERVRRASYLEREILGPRGRILDQGGQILALDLGMKDICIDPERLREMGKGRAAAFYLSHYLGVDRQYILGKVAKEGRRWESIKRHVNDDTADRIRRLGFGNGIIYEDSHARNYPLKRLLCHVVGFSNAEGVGSAGVEQEMNKFLRGRPGLLVSEKDARGQEIYHRRTLEIQPQAGADVWLTVDQNLQYFVEQALDAAMTEHNAEGAWAIVERIRTGEILAMASRPNFDLNVYNKAGKEAMRNRPLAFLYEPGSTMKAPVLAAALNEGVVHPDDVFDCEEGYWYYKGRSLRDYHGHGELPVRDIIKKSSNIGMAKIGLLLGEERLYRYLRDFGFGKQTGVDLPGEQSGIFHGVDLWSKISITRITMGHEIACTALQVLNAFCCIANDGFLMRPYIVDRVVDENGLTIAQNEPEVMARPIRPETSRLMKQLLGRVTEDGGTAKRARVEGYAVAGKTGTAQKPIPGGYSHTDHIASFVGFLPAEEPEIGIIVVVDNPQPIHTGGRVAAPVFKEIAEQAVRYLDIPPHRSSGPVLLTRAE